MEDRTRLGCSLQEAYEVEVIMSMTIWINLNFRLQEMDRIEYDSSRCDVY